MGRLGDSTQVSQQKTHYETLGVPRQATPEQIQQRYRELARRYHPDVAKDTALSRQIFTQITFAYQVLRDPKQRAAYDQTLSAPPPARPSAPRPTQRPPAPSPAAPSVKPTPRRPPERSTLQSAGMERLLSEAEGDALAEAGEYEPALAFYRRARSNTPNPQLEAKITRLEAELARNVSDAGEAEGDAPAPPEKQPFWRRLFRRDE